MQTERELQVQFDLWRLTSWRFGDVDVPMVHAPFVVTEEQRVFESCNERSMRIIFFAILLLNGVIVQAKRNIQCEEVKTPLGKSRASTFQFADDRRFTIIESSPTRADALSLLNKAMSEQNSGQQGVRRKALEFLISNKSTLSTLNVQLKFLRKEEARKGQPYFIATIERPDDNADDILQALYQAGLRPAAVQNLFLLARGLPDALQSSGHYSRFTLEDTAVTEAGKRKIADAEQEFANAFKKNPSYRILMRGMLTLVNEFIAAYGRDEAEIKSYIFAIVDEIFPSQVYEAVIKRIATQLSLESERFAQVMAGVEEIAKSGLSGVFIVPEAERSAYLKAVHSICKRTYQKRK